ncbi:MAG: hypothetical protein KDB27_15370 [Planctomycetales bacterium]|nr:hypothetical protein [Planctomycetales bacterium]
MDRFHSGLWRCPALIVSLPADQATSVLQYLLTLACECQNHANILLGRRALAAMPPDWLADRIHTAAKTRLNLTDDWECRRLIEVYAVIDINLAIAFAEACSNSQDSEIATAGREFLDDPQGIAAIARLCLDQPLP